MHSSVRSLVALLLAVALLVYPATVLANDTGGTAAEGTGSFRGHDKRLLATEARQE